MIRALILATNLHSDACFLMNNIKLELCQLDELLQQLQKENCTPLLYCNVKKLFWDYDMQIFQMQESIASMLENPEVAELKDELIKVLDELKELAARCQEMDKQFSSYLFCPALNRPETVN